MTNLTTPYNENNIFAKIINNEAEAIKIYEDDNNLAIMDIMPQSLGHCLVIPKVPVRNILDISEIDLEKIILIVQKIVKACIQTFNADGAIISQYNGEAAGQTVFHLHFHVIPKYKEKDLSEHAKNEVDIEFLKKQANLLKKNLTEIMF